MKAAIVVALAALTAQAQESPRQVLTPAELVRQLADPSFRVREKAEAELLRRGAECITEIQRGAGDDDLEIRRRCEELLEIIPQSQADKFLASFLARKEDPQATFPGWHFLRDLVGDDDGGRSLYARLYKFDRKLLDAVQTDPKSVVPQFDTRLQKIQPRVTAAMRNTGDVALASTEDVAALFVVANAARTTLDLNASQRLFNAMYQPATRQAIAYSEATRRLMSKWLELKCDDPQLVQQVANAANQLGCGPVIEEKLRPATVKLIDEAAAKPSDLNLVYRAINMAHMLNMRDVLEKKLRPAVGKAIQEAVREPIDLNKLNQLTSAVQSLGGVDNQLQQTIRPAIETLVKKQAENVGDLSRFYAILNLSRAARCADLLEEHLVPALRESMVKQVSQPGLDFNKLTQTLYHAQNLGMQEDIEAMLKPAAQRMLASALVDKMDAAKVQQAMSAAQAFQLRDALTPLSKKMLDEAIAAPNDINRLSQAVQLAKSNNLPDLEEYLTKKVKPAASAGLASLAKTIGASDGPSKIVPALLLADQLQLKEGNDVALAALDVKTLPAYQKSQALFMIAKNGTKDAALRIEPLLDEKAELGSASINGMMIRAQVRDVALATLVQLTGQKLTDYDFPFFRVNGQVLLNQGVFQPPGWYGFENDAARNAAIKKYRDSRTAK